jgi:hypothetical protein
VKRRFFGRPEGNPHTAPVNWKVLAFDEVGTLFAHRFDLKVERYGAHTMAGKSWLKHYEELAAKGRVVEISELEATARLCDHGLETRNVTIAGDHW